MKTALLLTACLCLCTVDVGCKKPTNTTEIAQNVKASVEKAGRTASHWSLQQADKVSHTVATFAARQLSEACNTGIDFLEDPGTQDTAEVVNEYLFNVILANINPAVGAGIQTAAAILDHVLAVPAGQTLTKAELAVLAAFLKGVRQGAGDFLDGKVIAAPPQPRAENKPRVWLSQPLGTLRVERKRVDVTPRGVDKSVAYCTIGETIPPDSVRGVTCADGVAPGYGFFWTLITSQYR